MIVLRTVFVAVATAVCVLGSAPAVAGGGLWDGHFNPNAQLDTTQVQRGER